MNMLGNRRFLLVCLSLIGLSGFVACSSSRGSYQHWVESTDKSLKQEPGSLTAPPDTPDDQKLTDKKIKNLEKAESYVTSHLPVENIEWSYQLEDVRVRNVWSGTQYIFAETEDYHLWAIDRQTGNPQWKFSLDGRLEYPPALVHGIPQQKIEIGKQIEETRARLAEARAELKPDPDQISNLQSQLGQLRGRKQALISDDRMYLIVGTTLYVVDREFGTQIDRKQLTFAPAAMPYATTSRIVIPGYGNNMVHFLRPGDLLEMDKERLAMKQPMETRANFVDPTFLLPGQEGTLYAWNHEERKWAWYKKTDGPITARPVVWENNVYLVSEGMQVYGLSRRTGNNIWTRQLSTPISNEPTVSAPNLYVLDNKQRFYCFDLEDGSLKWKKKPGGPKSFLFRNNPRIFAHNPKTKTVFSIDDRTGEVVAKGDYKSFPFILQNKKRPVFLLANKEGMFIAARAKNTGMPLGEK